MSVIVVHILFDISSHYFELISAKFQKKPLEVEEKKAYANDCGQLTKSVSHPVLDWNWKKASNTQYCLIFPNDYSRLTFDLPTTMVKNAFQLEA